MWKIGKYKQCCLLRKLIINHLCLLKTCTTMISALELWFSDYYYHTGSAISKQIYECKLFSVALQTWRLWFWAALTLEILNVHIVRVLRCYQPILVRMTSGKIQSWMYMYVDYVHAYMYTYIVFESWHLLGTFLYSYKLSRYNIFWLFIAVLSDCSINTCGMYPAVKGWLSSGKSFEHLLILM